MGTSLFKAKCPIFFISSYPKIVPPWTSTRSFKLAPDSSWHVHVILWALPRFRHSKTLPASLVPLLPQHHSHPLLHGAQWLSPRSAYALYSMLPGCLCAHTRVHAHTLTHTIYIYLSVCWKRIHTSSDGIHSSFFSRHISNSLTLRNPAPQNLGIFALCIKSMMSSDPPPGPPHLPAAISWGCPHAGLPCPLQPGHQPLRTHTSLSFLNPSKWLLDWIVQERKGKPFFSFTFNCLYFILLSFTFLCVLLHNTIII